ncbi:MAG: DUF4468 domain-containing protein [Chitinophagales bacterium]
MKNLFFQMLYMAFLIPVLVCGQETLTYEEVIQVESMSKEELFNRAKFWFVASYNSYNDVLQLEDKENGVIIGKANIKYEPSFLSGSGTTRGVVSYMIKVSTKEGRYKYEITDFFHDPYDKSNTISRYSVGMITNDEENPNPKAMAKGWSNKVWKDIKSQIESEMSLLIISLTSEMNKPVESEEDDW